MNQTEFQKPSVLRLCLLHCQFTSKLKKTSYMIFKVFPILWLPAEAHKRWYIESQLQYFLRVIFILFKRWPKNIYKEDTLDLFNILSLLYSDSSVISLNIFLSLLQTHLWPPSARVVPAIAPPVTPACKTFLSLFSTLRVWLVFVVIIK